GSGTSRIGGDGEQARRRPRPGSDAVQARPPDAIAGAGGNRRPSGARHGAVPASRRRPDRPHRRAGAKEQPAAAGAPAAAHARVAARGRGGAGAGRRGHGPRRPVGAGAPLAPPARGAGPGVFGRERAWEDRTVDARGQAGAGAGFDGGGRPAGARGSAGRRHAERRRYTLVGERDGTSGGRRGSASERALDLPRSRALAPERRGPSAGAAPIARTEDARRGGDRVTVTVIAAVTTDVTDVVRVTVVAVAAAAALSRATGLLAPRGRGPRSPRGASTRDPTARGAAAVRARGSAVAVAAVVGCGPRSAGHPSGGRAPRAARVAGPAAGPGDPRSLCRELRGWRSRPRGAAGSCRGPARAGTPARGPADPRCAPASARGRRFAHAGQGARTAPRRRGALPRSDRRLRCGARRRACRR